MAENENAVQDPTLEPLPEAPYQYEIKIEDAGPATKKVSIEIPPERIAAKLEEQFKELRSQAVLPGFRPGHAPRRLIEKKFHNDVREQVRRNLVSESFEQAVQKHSLKVIGDPKFDNPDEVKLPETGSFTYSFQVEVQPEFVLPNLDGLKVRKPKVELTDTHVEEAMKNLRSEEGALIPVEDRGIAADEQRTRPSSTSALSSPTFTSSSMASKRCIGMIYSSAPPPAVRWPASKSRGWTRSLPA